MNIAERNAPVTMIRRDLEGLPEFPLPADYSIRGYLPGDEREWVRIHVMADLYNKITPELFRSEFGEDAAVLGRRQFYLLDPQGSAVGTATAWYDDNYHGQSFGRVHWVAIEPGSQGRGLSKPLMSKVCCTLRELGHERAYLSTSTVRIAAITLYLRFGFVPEIRTPEDAATWAEMERYVR